METIPNDKDIEQERIMSLCLGFLHSAALRAFAECKVADTLATGPLKAEAMAEKLNLHSLPLYQTLRLLATVGLVHEDDEKRFSLTDLGQRLRSDVPHSLREAVIMHSHDIFWAPAGRYASILKTGQTPFCEIFGEPFFDYFARDPEVSDLFHRGMANTSDSESYGIVRSFDFSPFTKIVDVGGGHGSFISEILKSTPNVQGILFDAEHVLSGARIAENGFADRCELATGDFFEEVPGGDCLILKRILHDWSDQEAIAILRNCRRAMNDQGRVLIVDAVLPENNEPHMGKMLDVLMMVSLPGRERTEANFKQMLGAAELKLERIVATPYHLSIVEASRA